MSTGEARLLRRGGRILGLAALAHARGRRAGEGPWHVLPAETAAAVEEVLAVIEAGPDPESLTRAVRAAMGPQAATAAPSFAARAWENPDALERLGEALDRSDVAAALSPTDHAPSARRKALAALAVALSRSPDAAAAVAERIAASDGDALARMACLAGAVVGPGEPSRMRARIRRILEEAPHGPGDQENP
ncbi:MAG: hypothetical protein PHU25_02660 [Deltaproteobacteria bacterium]|nr:hypothetical protein [Deltaproteobacteria bacterium]